MIFIYFPYHLPRKKSTQPSTPYPHPRLHPPPCEGWCQWSTARRKPKNSADPHRGWADRSDWLEKFWMFPSLAYIHPSEVLGGFFCFSDQMFYTAKGPKTTVNFHPLPAPQLAVGQSGESVTTAVYWPWLLPSGYVKIAFENDHRNSGFTMDLPIEYCDFP